MKKLNEELVERWAPVLEGISTDYDKEVTAQLLENQAAAIIQTQESNQVNEDAFGLGGATTVGQLGTFQKFAFPLIRRVYPELIANKICGVQPMTGPVSQVFYLGHTRQHGIRRIENIYSKFALTYRNLQTAPHFGTSGNIDLDTGNVDTSQILDWTLSGGSPCATMGGKIAAWPYEDQIYGFNVSAGELLTGSGIPEINFSIQQQAVVARTKKMRCLWTLEAAQDLRAYHNLDLERELTDLLGKELKLEIDRELIEDLRMIAYDVSSNAFGGFSRGLLDQGNANNFLTDNANSHTGNNQDPRVPMVPGSWTYDQSGLVTGTNGTNLNVFLVDFTSSALPFAPQHIGHTYANLLAVLNLASQDIYKSTFRGPGSWILCAPLVAAMLESASKLEGGIARGDGPTNIGNNGIEFRGKFAGRYDLFVDPMYPEDEIMMGYKGSNAMDAGLIYAPYIPLQQLPLIHDPETFQPRKGILTRYGKVAITPESRFYRIIRIVGPAGNYLTVPFAKVVGNNAVDWGQ